MLEGAAQRGLARVVRDIVQRMRAKLEEAALFAHMESAAAAATKQGELASQIALVEEGLDVTRARIERLLPGDVAVKQGLLHLACNWGHLDVVAYLIELGWDPREHDSLGFMPHHIASLPVVQCLVNRFSVPVDAEMRGRKAGATVLHAAAFRGKFEQVRWLLGAGADPRRTCGWDDGVEGRPSELAE
jgi:ankyrin repeat protein